MWVGLCGRAAAEGPLLKTAAEGTLRKGRYGRAAVGGPLLHGRCGRRWADDSEEEEAPIRRQQKLVLFNTNKTEIKQQEGQPQLRED